MLPSPRARSRWFALSGAAALACAIAITFIFLLGSSAQPRTICRHRSAQPATGIGPPIAWQPSQLVVTLTPGENKNVQVVTTAKSTTPPTATRVVPALAPFMTVSPSAIPSLSSGATQTLSLSFSVPVTTSFQSVKGTLQLRAGAATIAPPLPIDVEIAPEFGSRYVEPTTGISLALPVLGSQSQGTSSVTGGGIIYLHIISQSLVDQSPVDQIDLEFLPNPSSVPISEWFQQNVDPQGELRSSGAFSQETLSNGMTAYINTGSIPADYVNNYGPVLPVYAAFPFGGPIVEATQSQANELGYDGYTATNQLVLVRLIVESIQLP
jgi:hypothetical protein